MKIETDLVHAQVKTDDWLNPVASSVMRRIHRDDFGEVSTSREAVHELYYASMEESCSLDTYISRLTGLTAIDNLKCLETTVEIDMLAATLIKHFHLISILDAYYAPTALNAVSDHPLVSTDDVFDQVTGPKRVDPRNL